MAAFRQAVPDWATSGAGRQSVLPVPIALRESRSSRWLARQLTVAYTRTRAMSRRSFQASRAAVYRLRSRPKTRVCASVARRAFKGRQPLTRNVVADYRWRMNLQDVFATSFAQPATLQPGPGCNRFPGACYKQIDSASHMLPNGPVGRQGKDDGARDRRLGQRSSGQLSGA